MSTQHMLTQFNLKQDVRLSRMYTTIGFAAALLFLSACTFQPLITPDTQIFIAFSTQAPADGERDVMEAQLFGTLIVDGPCLLVDSDDGDVQYQPIWPPGYDIDVQSQPMEILDEQGIVAARVGDSVYLSGGEVPQSEGDSVCPQRHWIVGDTVAVIAESKVESRVELTVESTADETAQATCDAPAPIQIALQENPNATLAEMAAAVNIRWMVLSTIHHVDIVPTRSSSEFDPALLLVKWHSPLADETTLTFLWQEAGQWRPQTFCISNQNLLDARVDLSEDGVSLEATAIFDLCVGATSGCQHVRTYQLRSGEWRESWNSETQENWPRSHTSVRLPDGEQMMLLVRSSSWAEEGVSAAEAAKRQIFHESNAGPHRWFDDVWMKEDNGFVHTARFTEPSAYNTLVEFIYALKYGGAVEAWTISPWIAEEAISFDIDKVPAKIRPHFPADETSVEQGPISISMDEQTIVFDFISSGGRVLISGIQVVDEAFSTGHFWSVVILSGFSNQIS